MKKILIETLGVAFAVVFSLVCICITMVLAATLVLIKALGEVLTDQSLTGERHLPPRNLICGTRIDPPMPSDLQILDAMRVARREEFEGRPN